MTQHRESGPPKELAGLQQLSLDSGLTLSPEAQGLIDAIPQYVLIVDEAHHIVAANRAVTGDLGVEPSALLGRFCPQAIHGSCAPFPDCPLEEAVKGGRAVERDIFDEDRGRWVRSAIYPLDAAEGRPLYLHLVQDITARVEAEQALRASLDAQQVIADVLRLGLEDLPLDVVLERALGLVLSLPWLPERSRGAIFLVDRRSGDLLLRTHVGLTAEICRACARVESGGCLCGQAAERGEVIVTDCVDERHEIAPPGMTDHGHCCVPIIEGGEVLGVLNTYLPPGRPSIRQEVQHLETIADALAGIISRREADRDRAALESHLRQAQKMEAIGRLAGGIIHDFNNFLTVILGTGSILLEELGEGSPHEIDAKIIVEASRRASSLTRQLLAFSRKEVSQPEVINLNESVRSIEKMLRRLIGDDIRITLSLDDGAPPVFIDPVHVEQILVNLATNARDAMPLGGELRIETSQQRLDDAQRHPRSSLDAGAYTLLSIKDTGEGMHPEVREQIFEPFFTTKETGRGTGLGLSTVHGIVTQAGGGITVKTSPQKGTTFEVALPAVRGAQRPRAPSLPPEATSTLRQQRVLMVEDDEPLRRTVTRLLERRGYAVIAAESAEEAIALFEANPDGVDLLLSDYLLPKMNGSALCRRLREARPTLRAVLMSGYAREATSPGEGDVEVLAKPFTAKELLSKLTRVFGEV